MSSIRHRSRGRAVVLAGLLSAAFACGVALAEPPVAPGSPSADSIASRASDPSLVVAGVCALPSGLTVIERTATTATLQWQSSNLPIMDHCWDIEVGLSGFTCGTGTAVVAVNVCTSTPGVTWDPATGVVSYTVAGLSPTVSYAWSLVEICDLGNGTSGPCTDAPGPAFTTFDDQFIVQGLGTATTCPESSAGYVANGSFAITLTDGASCPGTTYSISSAPVAASSPLGNTPSATFPNFVLGATAAGGPYLFTSAGAGSYFVTVTETGPCNPAMNPVIITVTVPESPECCAAPTNLTVSSMTATTATLEWKSLNLPIVDHCWDIEVGLSGFTCGTGAELVALTVCTNTPGVTWDPATGVVSYTVTGLTPATGYAWSLVETCDGPVGGSGSCANALGPAFMTFDDQFIAQGLGTATTCPESSAGYVANGSFAVTLTDGASCPGTTYSLTSAPVAGSSPLGNTPSATFPNFILGATAAGGPYVFTSAGAGSYFVTVTESGPCNPAMNPVIITVTVPESPECCAAPTNLVVTSMTTTTAMLEWKSLNLPIVDHCWDIEVGLSGFTCGTGAELVALTVCTNTPGVTWDPATGVVSYTVTGLTPATGYAWSLVETCDGPVGGSGSCANALGPAFTTFDDPFTVFGMGSSPTCPESSAGYLPDGDFVVSLTDGASCPGTTYLISTQPVPNSSPLGNTPAATSPNFFLGATAAGGPYQFFSAGAGSYLVTVTETGPCNPAMNPVVITVTVPDSVCALPVVTCPPSRTLIPCLDQDTITDEFDAWLGGFSGSGGCLPLSITNVSTLGPPPQCGGEVTVDFLVIDACGRTAMCSSTFTIESALVIDCPPDQVLECPSDTSPATTGSATSGACAISFADTETPGCSGTRTIVRTWTATNPCGTSVSCVQSIEVVDTTPPVLTVPPDMNVICDDPVDPAATGMATAVDACSTANVTLVDSIAPGPEGTTIRTRTWTATDACGNGISAPQTIIRFPCPQDRTSATEKGGLLAFSKVEIRWDAAGNVVQDTFLTVTNDGSVSIDVKMYFVNGDAPAAAGELGPGERSHPGWNATDVRRRFTRDQPAYWSALTGQPGPGGAALSPFTILDPSADPLQQGRPAVDGTTDRVLRGFVYAWAEDDLGNLVKFNHLGGEATLVNYRDGYAWEYDAWAFQSVLPVFTGQPIGAGGVINLDGTQFAPAYGLLLLDFLAAGSQAFSGGNPLQIVSIDTDLTLHPVSADLRQETDGPVTTKASFVVWNENETQFSGLHRCITCWDQTLLSQYSVTANHFLLGNLQTDKGKARIDGLASQLCNVDFVIENPPLPIGDDPRDVVSQNAALLGVAAKLLAFNGVPTAAAGLNLIGMGAQGATVRYDAAPGGGEDPPTLELPTTPEGAARFLDAWGAEIGRALEGVVGGR